MTKVQELRNIAIIAHVDHGKTTLVDQMLAQSGAVQSHQTVQERALDSNDLERERGITILAKCTSVTWNDVRINIVDTPGHADFGGEVERILSMVDGVVLLVDAAEGPMPQTKFVLGKALALGLKPIVVMNKTDRPDARADEAHDEVFDLFSVLGATDEQLDFPMLYASGRSGWASFDLEGNRENLTPLFETILTHVQPPEMQAAYGEPFAMLATILEVDPYLGRLLTGRVEQGTLKANQTIKALSREGKQIETARVTKILASRGLTRQPIDEAKAGDIVTLAGLSTATVADTICEPTIEKPIAASPIDPPTITMTFSINNSPLAGREGSKVQSRVIRERLTREAESNVALTISEAADKDSFDVSGRGELQLGVLIETMRREGFELSISRPRVVYREDPETGEKLEPIEEVQADVDDEYSGIVIEKLNERRGELIDMRPSGGGKTRLIFHCPARALIGYYGEFLTDTRGTGILHRIFQKYAPYKGKLTNRRHGVLISNSTGDTTAFALWNLEDRGEMFVDQGVKTYEGMIVGEYNRPGDLVVNPLKAKQLTNIRAAGKDDAIRLSPPRRLNLEQAIAYINDDELVEVTPENVRVRKRVLAANMRKRSA